MLQGIDPKTAEQAELERVLTSGIFARSPNLATFLQYIGAKYFEGHAQGIKEYNIAVEALGRPADFDQKKDSIVRVEAHRLRKRLEQYYHEQGADNPVQITIPPGSYAPQFVQRALPVEPDTVELIVQPPKQVVPASSVTDTSRHRITWIVGVLVALAVLASTIAISRVRTASAPPVTTVPLPVSASPDAELRILVGSNLQKYVDHYGNVWSGDRYYRGGEVFTETPRLIARTLDPLLYLSRREGDFWYDIPLKPGMYQLRLHFAETVFGEGNIAGGGESSRIFSVKGNDKDLLLGTDIVADAPGSNTAHIRVYKDISPAQDGYLHLHFYPFYKEKAFVNAIEIVPSSPGRMNPVRILARGTGYTDPAGRQWEADQYVQGGQQVQRYDRVRGTDQQDVYQSERYGHFTYSIPVAPDSRYTVTLKFAEHWFGPGRTGTGGTGSRVFDVYCNGRTLLRNFDPFKEAGGPLKAIDKTFRNLEPNAQGKLVFQFVPVVNYGLVNGIEIVDEGK